MLVNRLLFLERPMIVPVSLMPIPLPGMFFPDLITGRTLTPYLKILFKYYFFVGAGGWGGERLPSLGNDSLCKVSFYNTYYIMVIT